MSLCTLYPPDYNPHIGLYTIKPPHKRTSEYNIYSPYQKQYIYLYNYIYIYIYIYIIYIYIYIYPHYIYKLKGRQ